MRIIPVLLLKVVKWYQPVKVKQLWKYKVLQLLRFAPDEALTRRRLSGVAIVILTNCTTVKWNIEMNQVTFIDNINPSDPGGGLYVLFTGGTTTTPTHYLRISNCVFQSGLSSTGGGVSVMATFNADHFDDVVNKTHEWMSILHSHRERVTQIWTSPSEEEEEEARLEREESSYFTWKVSASRQECMRVE